MFQAHLYDAKDPDSDIPENKKWHISRGGDVLFCLPGSLSFSYMNDLISAMTLPSLQEQSDDTTGPMLIVTQKNDGSFECYRDGDVGSHAVGRGASVLEAVGSWCIYSAVVTVTCQPPAILREFGVDMKYEDIEFKACPKR